MKVPSIRSLLDRFLGTPRGSVPKSFSEAQRFDVNERPHNPLEHSGVQPLGTPEFDPIHYHERPKRGGSAA